MELAGIYFPVLLKKIDLLPLEYMCLEVSCIGLHSISKIRKIVLGETEK
jgi:hypothetical protein